MFVTRLKIKNWRNFKQADVPLRPRQFIVGANAAGKSNLLDVFRFLRDIAKRDGGGLQKALADRGGLGKVRSLVARKDPEVVIEIHLGADPDAPPEWRYSLGLRQEARGLRRTMLTHERAWHRDKEVLHRPDNNDRNDEERLTQTSLEQINANSDFRDLAKFFEETVYLHVVPQLLKFADKIQGRVVEHDPFGQGFLERVARTPDKARARRLATIETALRVAVPQFQELAFRRDKITGLPHLEVMYKHWRPGAGRQREDQFSDGTLRLVGLLWSLLEEDALLLLEEPELSLNNAIARQIAPMIHSMQRRRKRQVFISTHSDALLSDPGIDGREVLLLRPAQEGSEVMRVSDIAEAKLLLEQGIPVSDVALSRIRPADPQQFALIDPDA